jgi:uncharacterized protein YbjT (DUF2867 family)
VRIAITGGTGTVVRHVAQSARDNGHEVVMLARRFGVDLLTGEGLRGALDEVDADIDRWPSARSPGKGTFVRSSKHAEHMLVA